MPQHEKVLIACDMFENNASLFCIAQAIRSTIDEAITILRNEYTAGTSGDYYLNLAELEAA